MRFFPALPRRSLLAVCALAVAASGGAAAADKNKPSLTMRALPTSGFAPLKVSVTVAIQGGANDYEQFYCPSIEWDWDDGTKSEEKIDCEPYEAGKSEIRRNFRSEHKYDIGGDFRVQFRLKQKKKTVASASTTIRVQGGIRDGYR
jgi:opacity protein-like surface antigen